MNEELTVLQQPNKVDSGQALAYTLLFLTAFSWGLSTVLSKVCISALPPGHILMVRAAIATLILFLASPRKILKMGREDLKTGLLLGLIVFFAYYLGIASLKYTSASKAGFLMALNVLFVPAAEAVLKKRLPSKWVVTSVLISLVGLKFISGINGGSFNFGDLLAFFCAVAYSVYTICLDRFGRDKDDYVLSFIQVAVLAVAAFCGAFFLEGFHLGAVQANLLPLLVMGVFGTGAATLFQTKAQKTASPESVGIILLADPICTLVLAAVFLHETILFSGLIGGGLIVLSCIIAIVKKV
ncbi:DMT family transporter [Candidatus Formimonas warabiya]|uniref:EamA domain-containing protein n=1 Tax=Formimonas warabiya TaxID=1761012 RepID=A0A3G1KRU9_FORW1|nr:DMT family transporter [Candidatus Formimonas warabiya]ATW25212.1 hypothetical protein DCMF_10930 [Candidatus Formimonas warabiya]